MKEGNTHPVTFGQPLCMILLLVSLHAPHLEFLGKAALYKIQPPVVTGSGAFDKALVVGILDLQAEQVSFH
jgi:hypothetical protein